jgi:hypothetical protein
VGDADRERPTTSHAHAEECEQNYVLPANRETFFMMLSRTNQPRVLEGQLRYMSTNTMWPFPRVFISIQLVAGDTLPLRERRSWRGSLRA